MWKIVRLNVSGGDPIRAKRLWEECTISEIAEAWQSTQAQKEGIGYKIET